MQALRPKLWAPLVLVLGGVGAFAASQGAPVEAADHNDPPNRVHSATPTTDDRHADIADVFAWTRGSGTTQTTVLAMSFSGPNTPAALTAIPCDRDVLYQIHITADGGICPTSVVDEGDGMTHACTGAVAGTDCGHYMIGSTTTQCHATFTDMHTINVRFAPNGAAATATCVVEAEFVGGDGATAISPSIAGMVETNLTQGTTQLYAGLRDDAFFFDLTGFQGVLTDTAHSLGNFHNMDTFAGMNTPVVVIEVPTTAIAHSAHALPGAGASYIRVWGSTSRFHPHT